MCFVSVVMDQYRPHIPTQWPPQQQQPWAPSVPHRPLVTPSDDLARAARELRELIESFKRAVEAAKTFDRLTGQSDCVDPEKAKLEKRVADLEQRLDALEVN